VKKLYSQDLFPPGDTKVFFSTATAFVRDITIGTKLIMLTGGDRGMTGSLESGYILIDQAHFAVKHQKKRKERDRTKMRAHK